MSWIPDSPLPYDGVDKWCDRCKKKIQPPRITAGYAGSGRIVYGGWYTIPNKEGIFCLECALTLVGKIPA